MVQALREAIDKSTSKKGGSKKSASSKKKDVPMQSATKAPKVKKVSFATDKKAPKPKVPKVTPPKQDGPNEVGVQLKRPPECLDEPCGKKARTQTN